MYCEIEQTNAVKHRQSLLSVFNHEYRHCDKKTGRGARLANPNKLFAGLTMRASRYLSDRG